MIIVANIVNLARNVCRMVETNTDRLILFFCGMLVGLSIALSISDSVLLRYVNAVVCLIVGSLVMIKRYYDMKKVREYTKNKEEKLRQYYREIMEKNGTPLP